MVKIDVVHMGSPWSGSTKRSISLVHRVVYRLGVHFLYMLWFNIILGLNFIFLCFAVW